MFLLKNSAIARKRTHRSRNRPPDGWNENPKHLENRDLDASYVKKNKINQNNYKHSTALMRSMALSDAS